MFFLFLEEQRNITQVSNSTIRDRYADIEVLITDVGNIPPHFSQDIKALGNITYKKINGLLAAYNLPSNGNLNTQKMRLARYIEIKMITF